MSKDAAWPENYKFAFGQSTQLTNGLSGKTNWQGSEDDFQPLFPSVEMDWPALRSLHCYPSKSLMLARILDCGGSLPGRSVAKTGAQRRHRFSIADRASKAAWRFASRRSLKSFGCGCAALCSLWLKFGRRGAPPSEMCVWISVYCAGFNVQTHLSLKLFPARSALASIWFSPGFRRMSFQMNTPSVPSARLPWELPLTSSSTAFALE